VGAKQRCYIKKGKGREEKEEGVRGEAGKGQKVPEKERGEYPVIYCKQSHHGKEGN